MSITRILFVFDPASIRPDILNFWFVESIKYKEGPLITPVVEKVLYTYDDKGSCIRKEEYFCKINNINELVDTKKIEDDSLYVLFTVRKYEIEYW